MWGTSSPGDKLTGDFGNEPDATSISDRGLFRLLAGNLSPGVLRLLQHNRHLAAPDVCDGTSAVGESRHRIPGASVGQPTEPCLAVRRVFEASEEAQGGRRERDRLGEAAARQC